MEYNRLRRLRSTKAIRDLTAQTNIETKNFILPYFVVEGEKIKSEIISMPGIYRFSIDNLLVDVKDSVSKGIKTFLIFGIEENKTKTGSSAYARNGIIQKVLRALKDKFADKITLITDVCLCGFTDHGHCAIINSEKIDNDTTINVLAKTALSHAQAGADFTAPSAMMDGQVLSIRRMLDNQGYADVGIMAYSAKYASNLYSPFRDIFDSSPKFGDRQTYQMDIRNSNQAMLELEYDIQEHADIVMVKPALFYLDIICKAKQLFNVPLAAYNVSGEYAMIKKLADGNEKLEKALAMESLISIKRAGADIIISYFAKNIGSWISE
ncbi:porphobilinogen synthase [bacterium]|nr:porphobilinogen synthase [bacterium]